MLMRTVLLIRAKSREVAPNRTQGWVVALIMALTPSSSGGYSVLPPRYAPGGPEQLPQQDSGAAVLGLLAEADKQTKALLAGVFAGNDFDQLLEGVNLMAVAGNGERVITNLLAALQPIIQQGAKRFYDQKAGEAVAAAKANRQQRRADKRRHK